MYGGVHVAQSCLLYTSYTDRGPFRVVFHGMGKGETWLKGSGSNGFALHDAFQEAGSHIALFPEFSAQKGAKTLLFVWPLLFWHYPMLSYSSRHLHNLSCLLYTSYRYLPQEVWLLRQSVCWDLPLLWHCHLHFLPCSSRNPIIGPVQEKDTNESVKAIRKKMCIRDRAYRLQGSINCRCIGFKTRV